MSGNGPACGARGGCVGDASARQEGPGGAGSGVFGTVYELVWAIVCARASHDHRRAMAAMIRALRRLMCSDQGAGDHDEGRGGEFAA